ncbi:MAG: hypothetical protein JXQ75_22485 [Phycisphaerae bacterium]|nr:hypothetical protein [Phycisphaerae bacterium]
MNATRWFTIAAAIGLLAAPASGQSWTTLDHPDGTYGTFCTGIDGDFVVGYYCPEIGESHGFLYDRSSGTWTSLDYPGAATTCPQGIDGDRIVGWYSMGPGNPNQAFLYDCSSSTWTTVATPGDPYGIEGDTIVGAGADWLGYQYDIPSSSYTEAGVPGTFWVEFHGISGDNIVGWYKQPGDPYGIELHGFRYDGVDWTLTDYDFPVQTADTYPTDIDGDKTVGFFSCMLYVSHAAFVLDGSTWSILIHPDAYTEVGLAYHMQAWGIDGDTIVGSFGSLGGMGLEYHGFVCTYDGPVGACCQGGTTCVAMTEAACVASGGTYQGDGTNCILSPCAPNAACCLAVGGCQQTPEDFCSGVLGGTWHPEWADCSVAACPQPQGACCVNMNCTMQTEANCAAAGGTWHQGMDCSNGCPAVCCQGDGSCVVSFEAYCQGTHGEWHPEWANCSVANCPPGAACCLADGSCYKLTQAWCNAYGGTWHSEWADCSVAHCPQPGACCMSDAGCLDTTEDICASYGGYWLGARTACSGSGACPGVKWNPMNLPAPFANGIPQGINDYTIVGYADISGHSEGFMINYLPWGFSNFQAYVIPGAASVRLYDIESGEAVTGGLRLCSTCDWRPLWDDYLDPDPPHDYDPPYPYGNATFQDIGDGLHLGMSETKSFIHFADSQGDHYYEVAIGGYVFSLQDMDPRTGGRRSLVGTCENSSGKRQGVDVLLIQTSGSSFDLGSTGLFEYPGATSTSITGKDNGRIVGYYTGGNPSRTHGFFRDLHSSQYYSLDCGTYTAINDISGSRIVAEVRGTSKDDESEPFLGEFVAACCIPDEPYCVLGTEYECLDQGGVWTGPFVWCTPDDCNSNDIADVCEIANELAADCDRNWIPDECEICGDLDNDLDVDYDDYVIFLDAFGGEVNGVPLEDACCDYDGSGAVGMMDYAAWLQCYRDFSGIPWAPPPSPPGPHAAPKKAIPAHMKQILPQP